MISKIVGISTAVLAVVSNVVRAEDGERDRIHLESAGFRLAPCGQAICWPAEDAAAALAAAASDPCFFRRGVRSSSGTALDGPDSC